MSHILYLNLVFLSPREQSNVEYTSRAASKFVACFSSHNRALVLRLVKNVSFGISGENLINNWMFVVLQIYDPLKSTVLGVGRSLLFSWYNTSLVTLSQPVSQLVHQMSSC